MQTLTSKKDIASTKTELYPFPSPFLKFLRASREDSQVIGMTDPLTNEITVLNLSRIAPLGGESVGKALIDNLVQKRSLWKGFLKVDEAKLIASALVNELNHSSVIDRSPQRLVLHYPMMDEFFELVAQHIKFSRSMMEDWADLLESIALYENINVWGVPPRLYLEIMRRLRKNRRMSRRYVMFKRVVNRIVGRNLWLMDNLSTMINFIRTLGNEIATAPFLVSGDVLPPNLGAVVPPNFDEVLHTLLALPKERIPACKTFEEIQRFIDSFFNNLYSAYKFMVPGVIGSISGQVLMMPFWVHALLSADRKRKLAPFIFGILNNIGLLDSIVYESVDMEFRKRRILDCYVPRSIESRKEKLFDALEFVASLRSLSAVRHTTKARMEILERLIGIQEWIQMNCLRDCIGKKNCPLLESGKAYDQTKRSLSKVSARRIQRAKKETLEWMWARAIG